MKQNTPTINNLNEEIFIFFDSKTQKNHIKITNDLDPEIAIIFLKLTEPTNKAIIVKKKEYCSKCGAPLNKNGLTKIKYEKKHEIYLQKYVCSSKKCKHYETTDITKFKDKYCNYSKKTKEKAIIFKTQTYIPYNKVANIINKTENLNISHQTIYNTFKQKIDDWILKHEKHIKKQIKEHEIEYSGIIHYDEQYLNISRQTYLRLSIIDAISKITINTKIIHKNKFNQKTFENFIKESTKEFKLKVLITDGHPMYKKFCKENNIIHQQCVFHLIHEIRKPAYKQINKLKRQNKTNKNKIEKITTKIEKLQSKIQIKRGRIKKTDKKRIKINEQIKSLKIQLNILKFKIRENKHKIKKLEKYMDKISLIFKSKKIKTATKRINKLKEEIDQIPEIIAKKIPKITKNIENYLNHMKNKNIPKTNNTIELLFRTTLPRSRKNIFRTVNGVKNEFQTKEIIRNYKTIKQFLKKKFKPSVEFFTVPFLRVIVYF